MWSCAAGFGTYCSVALLADNIEVKASPLNSVCTDKNIRFHAVLFVLEQNSSISPYTPFRWHERPRPKCMLDFDQVSAVEVAQGL